MESFYRSWPSQPVQRWGWNDETAPVTDHQVGAVKEAYPCIGGYRSSRPNVISSTRPKQIYCVLSTSASFVSFVSFPSVKFAKKKSPASSIQFPTMRASTTLGVSLLATCASAWKTSPAVAVKKHIAENEYTLIACKKKKP